jgi:TonB family protein
MTGRVTIDCAVTDKGGLDDCKVASESPEGFGFGKAALQLSHRFQMNHGPPPELEPRPRLQIPLTFRAWD